MKKKILATSLTFLGTTIIGFSILLFLGLFKSQNAGLLIESEPQAVIFIDNKEVGITPYEITRKPGEISVRIKPVSTSGLVLDDYETKINLVSGIKTIIKKDFKADEDYSSSVIVSFEKVRKSEAYITAISVPDNAQVSIDGHVYGFTPLRVNISAGDHTLLISAENYVEQELQVRAYFGYKLTASVKLAKNNEIKPIQAPIVVEPEQVKIRIKINKTDIGFLRVRSGASIGFPEVGQVKPGEVYDVIEEGENGKWYKIQLIDSNKEPTVTGWVSAEFVTKI